MIAPYQTALLREKIDVLTECSANAAFLVLRDGFSEYEHGRTFVLEATPFMIGRARTCQLIVDLPGVSRQHAQVILERGQVFVADMNSANGTYVNGQRLTSGERRRLRAGDRINLANMCMLELDDPGETDGMLPVELPLAGLTLDESETKVCIDGKPLDPPLSRQQFVLLALLVKNEGKVVMREDIRRGVWGTLDQVTNQTIDALNNRLRKRLEEADPQHQYVMTRRGFGLMFRNKRAG
ncbi:MAG TPA: FHA domain-containing protein [Aggregatilineales bacterium]|nr:FHA domain-containing protein [Aggregatilineales bacterium]